MIIWRGRGILVAAITFGSCLTTELLTRACFHSDTYYQRQGWPMLAAFVVAAGAVWRLLPGRENQAPTGPDVFTDPQAVEAKKSVLRNHDEVFFVPVRFWPFILCALGVIFYFVRSE
jgi:hypothetical protein